MTTTDKSKYEAIALNILQAIHDLKKYNQRFKPYQTIEMFEIDPDFDVEITVRLISKKGQKRIGLDMFDDAEMESKKC